MAAVQGLIVSDMNLNFSCFVHNNRFCFLQVWCTIVFALLGHLRHWGTTNDFTTSFLHPLPSGTFGELQACPLPDVVFPPLLLSALSSSPFHCALQNVFWPDLMNGRHDHTTAVCVSLRWSGGLRVVQLPAGSWHGLARL